MIAESLKQIKDSIKLPVIMAPMFLVSNPQMIINACGAGIIGSFPALNARTGEILEEWLIQITTELEKMKHDTPNKKIAPWAIHFNVHQSNKRYNEDLKLIEKYQPPLIITSLGDPSQVVKVAHEYGGLVFSDVINTKFAKKVIEKGGDGLILVCNGAGGHAGSLNPISFIGEVREFWDGPIVLGGGISKGQDVLAAEVLGADFVYMGTRFIPTEESSVLEAYKEMLLNATVDDIVYTKAISGMNANFLIPSIEDAGIDLKKTLRREKINLSDYNVKAWKDVWSAGQGVGAIKEVQSISEIVGELQIGYENARKKIEGSKRPIFQNGN